MDELDRLKAFEKRLEQNTLDVVLDTKTLKTELKEDILNQYIWDIDYLSRNFFYNNLNILGYKVWELDNKQFHIIDDQQEILTLLEKECQKILQDLKVNQNLISPPLLSAEDHFSIQKEELTLDVDLPF